MSSTILVVEDESIVAQDIQMILEDLGYNVPETADSGELAIQKVEEINPDLILMDVRLIGEMDGITAAQKIVARFDVPIIFMTAHADEDTLARAKMTGPLGYIIKPFEERELRVTVEIALYKYKMEQRLRENAQWLATVLRSIGDGVISVDTEGYVTFINPVAEKLTGWSMAECVGKDVTEVFDIINEENRKPVPCPIAKAMASGEICLLPESTLLVKKDGREIPIDDSASPTIDKAGKITGGVLVFRDITERKLIIQKLHRQAFYDSLTDLPNRSWFIERLTDALARVDRHPDYLFAVLFLDLDGFKTINDSLGHTMGDRLLVAAASRLVQCVRSIDTVVRLGGDEFAILLESLQDWQEACHIAERIQQALNTPFVLERHEIFTSTSIGIVISSDAPEGVEDLLRDADIAMYHAKAQGRGNHKIFDRSMRDRAQTVLQLETDLRRAIERSQLMVFYQPIVPLTTRRIEGFEALVRWKHPERGWVSPAEFIPIAEETGLILLVDEFVLREACLQMKAWQDQHPGLSSLTMSVNLSSRQFLKPNLVGQIQTIVEETGLPFSSLKLEITESAIIENPESAATALAQLKALGIRLSLDDFGTGYSSLSYLHRFPVNTLKIDRSFINRIDSEEGGLEIVRTIVMLAQNLGLDAIAEGVENAEQLAILQELQCQSGQGYYFSRPLATRDIEPLLFEALPVA